MAEVARAFAVQNGADAGEWLTPFFSKNISPFAKEILEVFKKEALHGTPLR